MVTTIAGQPHDYGARRDDGADQLQRLTEYVAHLEQTVDEHAQAELGRHAARADMGAVSVRQLFAVSGISACIGTQQDAHVVIRVLLQRLEAELQTAMTFECTYSEARLGLCLRNGIAITVDEQEIIDLKRYL